MKMALFEDVPTILAKIMGIYEIKIGSRYHFRFIVMENLSFSCSHISRAFDLKGSRTNRHIDISDMNEEEIEAFVKLQKAIDECPLLYFPDPQAEVIMETDARDYGVGAYLYQKDPAGGENRPIAFISKTLQGSQRN